MDVLMPSESYGWARRKIREANVMLAKYPTAVADGNSLLISSLSGAREALMYLHTGSPRGSSEVYMLRASGQVLSEYERLLAYIDGVIEVAGKVDGRSSALYNLASALVSTVSDLVNAAGDLWGLEKPPQA
jgi:hypothetical protein